MNLSRLFEPESVAVIGASRDPNKVGSAVLKNLKLSYKGKIYPINPYADELDGFKTYKSVLNVPWKIDVAIVAIPADGVIDSLKQCEKKKIPFAVVLSAGFREMGGDGFEREAALAKLLEKSGIRLIGPNCLGIINTDIGLNATFIDPDSKVIKGSAGFISQSGAIMSAVVDDASMNKIGFSKVISIGNATDIDEADIIDYLAEDEKTKMLSLYLEGLSDGHKFMKSAAGFTSQKPMVVLKGGKSKASSGSVSSHTGSMAGNYKAYELAFGRSGAISVDNIDDLFNFMRDAPKLKIDSDEVIIVTNAGGAGVITVDHIAATGLKLASFSDSVLSSLRDFLPREANTHNPVDMVGDATPERYKTTLQLLVKQNKPMIILFSPQEMSQPIETAKQVLEVHGKHPDVPMLCVFLGGSRVATARKLLMDGGMPVYEYPNEAVSVIKGLFSYSSHRKQTYSEYSREKLTVKNFNVNSSLFGLGAKKIFDSIGMSSVNGVAFSSKQSMGKALAAVGYPCVMKIESNNVPHKNKIGAVVVGINNKDEAASAFSRLSKVASTNRLKKASFGLYEDANKFGETKIEVLIGAHRDPQFGPMVAVGLGGVFANEIEDTSFLLSEISDSDISELKESRIGRILSGATDEKTFRQVLRYLVIVDKFMVSNESVKDIDLNPLFLFRDRIVATDFKIFV